MVLYTLYFIFYSVYTFPPAPTASANPCLAYIPSLFFPSPLRPRCVFVQRLHARRSSRRGILCRWRSFHHSASSLSLSLNLSVHIFLEHLCSSDARVRTSRAPADVGACAHARAGRAAKEKHFSGALLLSLLVSFSYVSPVPRYYPLINCQRWREREGEEEWKKSGVEEGRKGKARESSKGSVSTCATCCACARIRVSRAKWQFRNRDILA